MRKQSSGFVKIHYFDYERVINRLHACASVLKKSNVNVERILLFGSLFKGTYGPGSDADILIVLASDSRKRSMDRIPDFLNSFSDVPVGVDVFPLTRAEIQSAIADGNGFIQKAYEKGMELGV